MRRIKKKTGASAHRLIFLEDKTMVLSEELYVQFAHPITVEQAVPLVLHAFGDSANSIPKIQIADANREVWLKLNLPDNSEFARVARLPAIVYRDADEGLIRHGCSVPEHPKGMLRDAQWRSLDQIIEVDLPMPRVAQPIAAEPRRALSLVRGGTMSQPDGLLTSVDDLKSWCETAPQSRLRCLRWVVENDDQRCLILGSPLPPIKGTYLIADGHLLVPGGWTWFPKLNSHTVLGIFDVPPNHWLLWESPKSHSLVSDQDLVVMSRASVRTT